MAPLILHAGPLQLALLPADGTIRYLMAGEHEVLRGIGAPVRDQAWATIPPVISDLVVDQRADSFRVTFTARCRGAAVDFCWRGVLTGTADGTVEFDFAGEAFSDFQRNRIGFCVLHGAEVAGGQCVVEHTDGKTEPGVFPASIRTGPAFANVRALTHRVTPDLEAEVRMEGDTFETEDQRNWTDASFKTYCTPLGLPWPVAIRQGTRVWQRVTVRLRGAPPASHPDFTPPWSAPAVARVTIGALLDRRLPALGTIWNAAEPAEGVIGALRPLALAHLRLDLWLNDPAHPLLLRTGAAAAAQLGAALELAVFVGDDAPAQLDRLRAAMDGIAPMPRIARWLVFHESHDCTPVESIAAARTVFQHSRFAAPLGGGTTDNFTELNYLPAVATAADFTVHACNPQVHAFDEASITETAALQALTVANARRLSGGRPVTVSPVTFTRRWRVSDAGAPTGRPAGLLPFQTDPRHASPFAAAWTVASLAALATEGAGSVTYFEAVGPNGLLTAGGATCPVYAVFAALAPFAGAAIVTAPSSHPLAVAALAFAIGTRRVLLLANLRAAAQIVQITGAWGESTRQLAGHEVALVPLS